MSNAIQESFNITEIKAQKAESEQTISPIATQENLDIEAKHTITLPFSRKLDLSKLLQQEIIGSEDPEVIIQ